MQELIIQMKTDGAFPTGMKKVGELVRCRNCKYWSDYGENDQGRCRLMQIYPLGKWYCANGKKQ